MSDDTVDDEQDSDANHSPPMDDEPARRTESRY